MAKYNRKIPQYAKDPADDPRFRIEEIAEVSIVYVQGRKCPMVKPVDRWEDFMDFDRNITKLGHKKFVRPVMEDEALPRGFPSNYVLVEGDERTRMRSPATPETMHNSN